MMWDFSWRRPPALPERLRWIHVDEPAMLEWVVRARHYNTFSSNVAFVGMVVFLILVAWFFYWRVELSLGDKLWKSGVVFLFGLLLVVYGYFNTVNIAYRLTSLGAECCIWKDVSAWGLIIVKWLAIFTGVLALFLVAIDPRYALGALVGAGGIGLRYYSMVNSESWRNLHSEYNHNFTSWDEVTAAITATNRNLVELKFDKIRGPNNERLIGSVHVFFRRGEREKMVPLITQYLSSDTPRSTGKVTVF